MAKQDAGAMREARHWLEWILARTENRSHQRCLRELRTELCERSVCLGLLPGERPYQQFSESMHLYLKKMAAKRGSLPVAFVPLGWLIVLPTREALCAYSARRYPARVWETAEELDHYSEKGATLLRKFASDTGRVSARLDEDAAELVLSDRRRTPLADCTCRALRTAEELGVPKKHEPKPQLPSGDTIARRATRLARKLLRAEDDGIESVQTYMFPDDDGEPAHDDQLQTRLAKDFQSALKHVQRELSKAFGKPLRTGVKRDRVIPLSGVVGFAIWEVNGRPLWAAVEHEDRELPYVLSLGTRVNQNKRNRN
jgi:hypothetical protein